MFFSNAALRRQRRDARQWLELAAKIVHFRRDLLEVGALDAIDRAVKLVVERLADSGPGAAEALAAASAELEKVLRVHGGTFYPRSFWAENTEMILVAAILALGIRAYFLQPFKIPTNSMYPTYNGMTFEIHNASHPAPNALMQGFRFLVRGASSYAVTASGSGEIVIPVMSDGHRYRPIGRQAKGRKWFILPTTLAEYPILVGNSQSFIRLPPDFSYDKVVRQAFEGPAARLSFEKGYGWVLRTGRQAQSGQTILSFEILSGDALFVDRFSYHFRPPRVGEPFVFQTDNIPGIEPQNRNKYYIKRLVGEGGDILAVHPPTLYRNGQPADASKVFIRNQQKEGEYEGYTNASLLAAGQTLTVPPRHYFAMGDNSDESSDSRFWGPVPEREVIGRAVFIYYPFTKHWGPSH